MDFQPHGNDGSCHGFVDAPDKMYTCATVEEVVVVRRVALGATSPAMWPWMDVPMGRLATVVAAMRRTVEPIHIHVCLCLHWDVCNACKLLQWSKQPHARVFWCGMMPSFTWLRLCRWYMSCLSHRSTKGDAVYAMQRLCQCRRRGRSLWPTLMCGRHVDICQWGYGHIETGVAWRRAEKILKVCFAGGAVRRSEPQFVGSASAISNHISVIAH